MEKLLNLLNEYHEDWWYMNHNDIEPIWCDVYWMPCGDSIEHCIISKSYWFIKWLVENDKIDHAKLSNYFIDKKLFWEWLSDLKEFEVLLMLLSISSSPIEDLISYLK